MQCRINGFKIYFGWFLLVLCLFNLLNINAAAAYRPVLDFTGDSRTDFTVITIPPIAGSPIYLAVFAESRHSGSE